MVDTVTGAHTIIVYRWEDDGSFNQDPSNVTDTTNKIFGVNEDPSEPDLANNPERMFRPFDRQAESILELQFEGSWGMDFTMTNPWWLQFVYGAPTVSGTAAPYTHDYSVDPSSPPKSAQVIAETHYPDGNVDQTIYKGCVATGLDIDCSVEDTVQVSLDGEYADEEYYATASNSPYGEIGSQPEAEYRPLHFGNSTLSMDVDGDGTAEVRSLVQDATVDFSPNVEMSYELGSRFAAAADNLELEPELTYTSLMNASEKMDERQQAYGSSSSTAPEETMDGAGIQGELVLDAGLSGEDNRTVISISGAFPQDHSLTNYGDPTEVVENDITRMVSEFTVSVTTDKAEAP